MSEENISIVFGVIFNVLKSQLFFILKQLFFHSIINYNILTNVINVLHKNKIIKHYMQYLLLYCTVYVMSHGSVRV